MDPLLSLKVLQHPSAKNALKHCIASSYLEISSNSSEGENDKSIQHNLNWIKQWPPKLTPKQYYDSTSPSAEPSIDARNAICLAHKFSLQTIRFFDLEKGAHFPAVHIQTALAVELYLLFCGKEHKLERALDLSDAVLNYLAYWNEGLGSRGSKTIKSIMNTMVSSKTLEEKISLIQEETSKVFEQLEKMRTKLREMVDAQLSRRECQQQCARAIREVSHKLQLAPTCTAFLSGPWYDALQHLYLTEGEKSSVWKNSLNTTKVFAEAFSNKHSEKEEENATFMHIKNDILTFLSPIQHSENEHDGWLDDLETEYWAIKKQLDVCFDGELDFPIIDIGDSLEVNISEKLIRKAKSYFEGDWFKFSGNYSGRSQILAISKNGHRYIFNNLNGQKTFDFNLKEFAYLLANGHAKHLESIDISDILLERITKDAIRKYASENSTSESSTSENSTSMKTSKNSTQAYRNKALEEAKDIQKRHSATEKILEEKQKVTFEDKNTGELEERIRILETEKALLQMELGQWISVLNNDEKTMLKLAVKLSSSNKYVFTNELGLGRREFSSDELVSKILSNIIEIHTK